MTVDLCVFALATKPRIWATIREVVGRSWVEWEVGENRIDCFRGFLLEQGVEIFVWRVFKLERWSGRLLLDWWGVWA